MGLTVFAVLCAVLTALLMWRRSQTRRIQAVLMIIVGVAASGWAGGLRDKIAHVATDASATTTTKMFGVAVPYAIAFVIVVWFALDMDLDGLFARKRKMPGGRAGRQMAALGLAGGGKVNKHQTTWFTPWLGLMLPVALAALPIVNSLPDYARAGATTFAAMIGS